MTPVYFPFTHISGAVSCALLSCFDKISLYSPARNLVPEPLLALEANHRLDIRLPEEQETDPLPALLREYRSWGELHRGERLDLHKLEKAPLPLSDDTSTAWIRSKIRRTETEENDASPPEKEKGNLLLNARLFLAIAQEYDLQGESLYRDLHRIGTLEKNLFHNLSPGEDTVPSIMSGTPLIRPADDDRPMPEERLSAWGRVYAHHALGQSFSGKNDSVIPSLFITSSREILSLLLSRVEGPELVCRVTNIPLSEGPDGQKPSRNPHVSEQIESILNNSSKGAPLSSAPDISYLEADNCHEETAQLTIYRINKYPLGDFFSEDDGPFEAREAGFVDEKARSYFFGLIEVC